MLQGTIKALADPTRRRILELLKKGPLSAGELGKEFVKDTLSHGGHHMDDDDDKAYSGLLEDD